MYEIICFQLPLPLTLLGFLLMMSMSFCALSQSRRLMNDIASPERLQSIHINTVHFQLSIDQSLNTVPCSSSSADAMHVLLNLTGEVKVDDVTAKRKIRDQTINSITDVTSGTSIPLEARSVAIRMRTSPATKHCQPRY